MKKVLLATLLIFSTSFIFAQDSKKQMTKEVFMQKMMSLKKRQSDSKAKTKAEQEKTKKLQEVRKSSDRLVKMLGEK